MTTWYWDPINGTDSNASAGNGDSFATRRKRLENFVAAATAPGDTIRCIKSPDPTSLGVTGVWTKAGDEYNTSSNISSSTNATPIVITMNSANYTALNPAVGDTVAIGQHATNTNANGVWKVSAIDAGTYKVTLVNADGTNSVGNGVGGATGYIKNFKGVSVVLASALTKNIAITGNPQVKTNWTASANVTCTLDATGIQKEGNNCQKIDIAAGFTTGLAAYWTLPASTDFSAYEQVSFWIRQYTGTCGAAGSIQLKLCSDTAGVTAVDTIDIPALSTNSTAPNRWTRITVDKAAALGSAIQSIAFYVVTDNGAQTFYLDNIIACKDSTSADSLSLISHIGKNVSTDTFYSIMSINETRVILDKDTHGSFDFTTGGIRGYYGATETVTTYKRESYAIGSPADTTSTVIMTVPESGTSTSPITYSGGWNSTDMSTQTGITWFDGRNGNGAVFYGGFSAANINMEKFAFSNYNSIFYGWTAFSGSFDAYAINNMSGGPAVSVYLGSTINIDFYCMNVSSLTLADTCKFTSKMLAGNNASVLQIGAASDITVTGAIAWGGLYSAGIYVVGNNNIIKCPEISYSGYGVNFASYADNKVIGATMSKNNSADIYNWCGAAGYKNYLNRCTLNSTTKRSAVTANFFKDGGLYSMSEGGVQHADVIYMPCGTISKQNSVRHTASGYAWKLSPTNSTYYNTSAPMVFKVAERAVTGGMTTTFSLWMYRDNTGLSARLVVRGGSIAGVDADVQSSLMSEAINTWGGNGSGAPLTVSVTPTETGVVEVFVECWASSTTYSLYVDDFSVS